MTRLINEEPVINSNSDNSCASSGVSSKCFDLDSRGAPERKPQEIEQQNQKRLHLDCDGRETEQEQAKKRLALDSSQNQRKCDEINFKQLQEDSNKPKRNPFCSRCRNHGKIAQVKGHKRHCDYRDCQCEGCKLVECRQIVSARQIKLRRNQKQDEEYGRRIEVSPPVLKSDSTNDSMTIFAKTLIGATSPANSIQHLKQLHAPNTNTDSKTDSTAPIVSTKQPPTSVSDQLTLDYTNVGQQPALQYTSSSSGARSISTSSAGHHQQQLHPLPTPPPPPHATVTQLTNHRLMAAAAAAAATSEPNCTDPTINPALAIPFHLFNLPTPMLSQAQAAAAEASLSKSTSSVAAIASATGKSTWTSTDTLTATSTASGRLLPSIQEQINSLDEIHHTYGSLAIFAWLRYEHFNLQKIRDLIELSRSSYDNLLNLRLMSHLSGSEVEPQNALTTFSITTTPTTSTTTTTTTSAKRTLHNEAISLEQKNSPYEGISLPPTSNHSTIPSVISLHQRSSSNSKSLINNSFQSSTASTVPLTSSLINSYNSINRDVKTTATSSCSGYTGDTLGASAISTSTTIPHTLPLPISLNSHPLMSSSDFLWPRDLKMSSAENSSVIRPEHLFSRFMHYQHFGDLTNNKTAHLHPHLLSAQHHHQHLSLSPPPLFVTNLSMPSSSSAASSSSTTLL